MKNRCEAKTMRAATKPESRRKEWLYSIGASLAWHKISFSELHPHMKQSECHADAFL
jgi:hypothetical protein